MTRHVKKWDRYTGTEVPWRQPDEASWSGGGTPPRKGCRGLLTVLVVTLAPTLIGLAGLAGGAIWAVWS